MKRIMSLLLVFCMLVVFAASCQKEPEETRNPDEATPAPQRDENTMVVWWSTSEEKQKLLYNAWEDFKALQTANGNEMNSASIHMFSVSGNSNGTAELEMQIAAGTAPDLVRMDSIYLTKLGKAGHVLDINTIHPLEQAFREQFFPSTWDALSYKDKIYGIPFDASTAFFGGKKEPMAKAGVRLPQTYQELLHAGHKLKESGLKENLFPYTLPYSEHRFGWVGSWQFLSCLWNLNGEVLKQDAEGNFTEAAFHNPDTGGKALEMLLELQEQQLLAPNTWELEESVFFDYRIGQMQNLQEDTEFSLVPSFIENGPRYSMLWLYGLSVVSSSRNPKLAYDFAVHLAAGQDLKSKEHYIYQFCKLEELLPAYRAAEKDFIYQDPVKQQVLSVALRQLEQSKSPPAVNCWPEIDEILYNTIRQVMHGEKDPAEALNLAKEEVDRLLQKENANTVKAKEEFY